VLSSRQLPPVAGADIRFVRGEVDAMWNDLAQAAGDKDIWLVGGGDLVGQFADAGHLDEIRVSVAPVTLESGKPLLPRRLEADRLTLESMKQVGQFAELVYSVRPPSD
jgi:dihydrofolate reductase